MASVANNGGPAFPQIRTNREEQTGSTHEHAVDIANVHSYGGMTMRDYFAAQALPQVMQSADNQSVLAWPNWAKEVAAASYEIADAMLAERERAK
jgi:hypothetical protein